MGRIMRARIPARIKDKTPFVVSVRRILGDFSLVFVPEISRIMC
jgi:hypothetical protein